MAVLMPPTTPMELLGRWLLAPAYTLTSPEVEALAGGLDQGVTYRWMIRLAVQGYFTRRIERRPGGNTLIHWTITPRGRAVAENLRRINR